MGKLAEQILALLTTDASLTDREITNRLRGRQAAQQSINQECRFLEQKGLVRRRRRDDGLLGNYLAASNASLSDQVAQPLKKAPGQSRSASTLDGSNLSEDQVKHHLSEWLKSSGWVVKIAWAKERGIDIEATHGSDRWIIEVKGCGSLQPMRVNYFIGILGELLQRMSWADARYSIALPDIAQYRGLWRRLPALAKERTGISLLLVDKSGGVTEHR